MLDNGIPPTVRDIQKACDISSTSVVDYNLRLLDRDGYLNRRSDMARGIELLDEDGLPKSNNPRVAIIGTIAAGEPIPVYSLENTASASEFDTIEVSPDIDRNYENLYGLKVKGQSMIDALIDDGDIVIIEPVRVVSNGEMVVAWLQEREEATLKRFYLEGSRVRLQPANSAMEPIYCSASAVEVRGRVVSVIRKF
jgi:repressor LexA